jgi:hypothetical protein
MMSLSFLLRDATHAEPFEPRGKARPDLSKAGTREAGLLKTLHHAARNASARLPFSPQRDASTGALIGQARASASKIDNRADSNSHSGP